MNKKIITIIILFCLLFAMAGVIGVSALLILANKKAGGNTPVETDPIDYHSIVVDYDNSDTIKVEDGTDVKISKAGTYTLTGESSDTSVIVDTDGEVTLILDNVNITNADGAVIYVINADSVNLVLKEDTTNTFVDGKSYSGYGDEDVDAVIYSKDDLIISGTGKLVITANYNHGIHSKDYIQILSGVIDITCENDGIVGKDYVAIKDGNITINSQSDGIKSSNDTDSSLGYVTIDGGDITIKAEGDSISAETVLTITGGTFNITSGGGATSLSVKTPGNSWWGSSNKDDTSSKGLKADSSIIITGGNFTISCRDDGIHSNGDIKISGGTFTVNSSDDGVHADGKIEITGGTLKITAAEGIEATYVKIDDGEINISASDDGINAGNKSKNYSVKVEINGGNITINMGQGDTDGIDSNGDLYINGGTLNITGQSPFDYDGTAKYNGGTMIVNGSQTTQITNQFMGGGVQPGGPQGGGRR